MRPSDGCDQDEPAKVASVEPQDGESQVLRDAPIVVRLSHPLDPASVTETSLWVQDPEGPVPGELHLSPDGQVVIWGGARPLKAGALHFLVATGLRDRRGRAVPPHWSRFVPCDLTREDLCS